MGLDKGSQSRPKPNKREERRRRAEWLLRDAPSGTLVRRLPTGQESAELLVHLERGASGNFGLVKLAHLDVDAPMLVPSNYFHYPRNRPWSTLVELAAWRSKDDVLAALLRAGADPTKHCRLGGVERANFPDKAAVLTALAECDLMLKTGGHACLSAWALREIAGASEEAALAAIEAVRGAVILSETEERSGASPVRSSAVAVAALRSPGGSNRANTKIADLKGPVSPLPQVDAFPSPSPVSLSLSAAVRDVLSTLPMSYQAWVVKQVVCMRLSPASLSQGASEQSSLSTSCSVCASSSSQTLRWSGSCQHFVCEMCVWQSFVGNRAVQSRPATCQQIEDVGEGGLSSSQTAAPALFRLRCPHCAVLVLGDEDDEQSDDDMQDAPASYLEFVKAASRAKYLALPARVADLKAARRLLKMEASEHLGSATTATILARKEKFSACNSKQSSSLNLGTVQSVRIECLFRAVAAGDSHRIRALVEAGCDVDGVNEYGQTACFLAASGGKLHCLAVLLRRGADPTKPQNGGPTPLSVARANGHCSCADLLIRWGYDMGRDIVVTRPPLPVRPPLPRRESLPAMPQEGLSQAGTDHLGFFSIDEMRTALSWYAFCPVVDDEDEVGNIMEASTEQRVVTTLIESSADHPGAGSYTIDGAFDGTFLEKLEDLWRSLPLAPPEKVGLCCNTFSFT